MASLHSALKALGPCDFSDLPTSTEELDPYLADLFSQAQTILESIPIQPHNESSTRPRSNTTNSIASSTSQISISSARSAAPSPEHAALQKEWGKPVKLSQKENPLEISVYKCAGKDGRGAWFARRSVHEGLSFEKFKRGFEKEFPTSLAVEGPPGQGNVRGIGAEKRVEDKTVPNRGKLEVYRLSAQFPGPTTPRDFVTLLVTSTKAMKPSDEAQRIPELEPRHYMIISKPCNHPETQPQEGFIRGQYESVEFIREIPRKLKASMSSTDLSQFGSKHDHSLGKDTLVRNLHKKTHPAGQDGPLDNSRHVAFSKSASNSRESSPSSRRRSATVGVPDKPAALEDGEHCDPEENPVEWIMVTRSDPGGSVPRFMVERGTPSSICADAQKFLNWASEQDEEESLSDPAHHQRPKHMESFPSYQANGHLAGINEAVDTEQTAVLDVPESAAQNTDGSNDEHQASTGIFASVAGTLGAYVPQAVQDRFAAVTPKGSPPLESVPEALAASPPQSTAGLGQEASREDAASFMSSTSFASADSHLESEEEPSISSKTSPEKSDHHAMTQHEKELAKLNERKAALDAKMQANREKLAKDVDKDSVKEQQALKKAEEKHEKELKKHEERHKKELEKLEQKRQKEAKKLEDRKKKQADKDEKAKLTRERDQAREELELLKKERDIWEKQIGELQRENTVLAAKIGRLEGSKSELGENRSRSSSLSGKKTKGSAETNSLTS